MNSHDRVLLKNWSANVDIQLLLDWADAVRYIVKYVSKQEKRSQPILDLFKSAVYAETTTTTTTPSVQKPGYAKYLTISA